MTRLATAGTLSRLSLLAAFSCVLGLVERSNLIFLYDLGIHQLKLLSQVVWAITVACAE